MGRARVWDSHLSVDWSKSQPSPRAQQILNRQPFRYWSSKVLNQSTHSNSWWCERKATFVTHTHDKTERKRIKNNPPKSKYVCIANGRNQTAGITHRRRCDDEGCVKLPPLLLRSTSDDDNISSEKYWIDAWLIICQSVLIYWLVFRMSTCESADCRLLAFVCANSALESTRRCICAHLLLHARDFTSIINSNLQSNINQPINIGRGLRNPNPKKRKKMPRALLALQRDSGGRRLHPVVTIYTIAIVKFCIRTFILLIWFFFSISFRLPFPSRGGLVYTLYLLNSRNVFFRFSFVCFFFLSHLVSLSRSAIFFVRMNFALFVPTGFGCSLLHHCGIDCVCDFVCFFPSLFFLILLFISFVVFLSLALSPSVALFDSQFVWIWIERDRTKSPLFVQRSIYIPKRKNSCRFVLFGRWMAQPMVAHSCSMLPLLRCRFSHRFNVCIDFRSKWERLLYRLCVQRQKVFHEE